MLVYLILVNFLFENEALALIVGTIYNIPATNYLIYHIS